MDGIYLLLVFMIFIVFVTGFFGFIILAHRILKKRNTDNNGDGDSDDTSSKTCCESVFDDLYPTFVNYVPPSIFGFKDSTKACITLDFNTKATLGIRYDLINKSDANCNFSMVDLSTDSDTCSNPNIFSLANISFPSNNKTYSSECIYPTNGNISVLYNNMGIQVQGNGSNNVTKTFNTVTADPSELIYIKVDNPSTTRIQIVFDNDTDNKGQYICTFTEESNT